MWHTIHTLHSSMKFWLVFCILDIILVGMGMGMGVLAGPILLGFPFGWILVRRRHAGTEPHKAMQGAFRDSMVAAAVTFALMLVIWAPTISVLFRPGFDIVGFGHPL